MRDAHRRCRLAAALAMAAFVLLPSTSFAQSTASIRGTVTDDQGGAIPAANITLRNQATGEERTTVSDRTGLYQIVSLPVGVYRLEVRLDGFQTRVLKDLRLEVAQTAVQNVKLAVGSMTEEVAVVGEAPAIESAPTAIGSSAATTDPNTARSSTATTGRITSSARRRSARVTSVKS